MVSLCCFFLPNSGYLVKLLRLLLVTSTKHKFNFQPYILPLLNLSVQATDLTEHSMIKADFDDETSAAKQ